MKITKYILLVVLLQTGFLSAVQPVRPGEEDAMRFLLKLQNTLEDISKEYRFERRVFRDKFNLLNERLKELREEWNSRREPTDKEKAELRDSAEKVLDESLDGTEKLLEVLLRELRENRKEIKEQLLPKRQ